MAEITYREAVRRAIDEEMARDENVILMGEEVAQYQGAYKVSQGLLEKYGEMRIMDTPITEGSFTGIGIGAAMAGLRPIIEWMTFNFSIQALDQVINNAAKMRYMSGGQFKMPLVFRGPNGPAEYLGSQHSQALYSIFAHVPGLKVITPATPKDAIGLLKTAIRDDNPVVCMEAELMYSWKGMVPEEEFLIPFGQAEIKRPGKDVTIVTFSKPLKLALAAAEALEKDGIDSEVLDLRTIRPLDENAIYESVKKTNRCVIIDESWPVASMASHIGHLVASNVFDYLDAPVELVTGEDVPMPYNHRLELAAQPDIPKVVEAVKKVLYLK